jgi:signal transduction histidine kinase
LTGFRSIRFAGIVGVALVGAFAAQGNAQPLTTALQVRSLSPAEAERGLEVKLRGVVVFVESSSAIFLQDDTSTTFFRLSPPLPELPRVGDEIELTSRTRMGLYLPGVDFATFRVLGRRALPPGIPVTYDDLHFGRYHYQRVTVEGIVRSVQPLERDRSLIRLAMGSRVIDVRVEKPPSEKPPVDHRVRITGLAAGLINTPRRQLVQPYLRVLDWDEVELVKPAPPTADVPQISAEELLAFRVTGLGEQRIRISGVVTASLGEGQVFLEQGTKAFAVRFSTAAMLAPGDNVTVVGFPSMDRFSASVVDAELLTREPGLAPEPLDIESLDELYGKPRDPLPGALDGRLVRVKVIIRDAFKSEDGTTLLVQAGRRTIQARVPEGISVPAAGSVVNLTGICQVETVVFGSGFQSRPGLVSLRLTSSNDLDVLRTPAWWTPRRLLTVVAALAGLTVFSGLWIGILRRQVRRQTEALRHRIESEAALEERQRIAREFHDTLEQELAGVSLRLDALATRAIDEKGRDLISASRKLVSRIQGETRDLISDLRDPSETAGDIVTALTAVAARQTSESGGVVRFEIKGTVPILPAGTVHDLRMIARESVNNALKHAAATEITIRIEATESQLTTRIIDNGKGFDVVAETNGKRGHFGCAGIRERARKLGAEVSWHSTVGAGTTVHVVLPLKPSLARDTLPTSDHLNDAKTSIAHPHVESAS